MRLGKLLIRAAREGVAIARGKADPATYRVHVPEETGGGVIKIQYLDFDIPTPEYGVLFVSKGTGAILLSTETLRGIAEGQFNLGAVLPELLGREAKRKVMEAK